MRARSRSRRGSAFECTPLVSGSFLAIVAAVALIGGATSAIASAGIGSMLVPVLALQIDPKQAVAITAVPHLVGGTLLVWQLRHRIDRHVLVRFGAVCAITSLVGAVLHNHAPVAVITYAFATLLAVAGITTILGLAERVHLGTTGARIAGAITGFFGGLAGEQGGLRAVGLLPFDLEKERFVATSTAVGVVIDVFRLPSYMIGDARAFDHKTALAVMVAGVVVGTLIGMRLLAHIPERAFKRVLGVVLIAMGALLVLKR
jgi:uncharacterized protein